MTVYDWLHSLLDYERLHFCVTDFVLIYEPGTSSVSVVRRSHATAEHSTVDLPSEFFYE
jgi:hypothetical protein